MYILIGYKYGYNIPTASPIIALVGGYDFFGDGSEHKSIYIIHENNLFSINVSVTTNNTHKMVVRLSRVDGNNEYLHMILLKIS